MFGGDNVIDIVIFEILLVECWNDLERLNKECELVGIYLLVYLFDEYVIVLEYVCNIYMSEFDDKLVLVGREIMMGGIVISVCWGISKNGNFYGIVKIEDYFGLVEIFFFGNDWVIF